VKLGVKQVLTTNRETDARTAITRGLREYLESLSIDVGGRDIRFQRVFEDWPEPEDVAVYPSALVHTPSEATYDASKFSPSVTRTQDGGAISSASEMQVDLTVEAWATDPLERAAIMAMLEDAFNPPVHARSGLILELPHYFSARATYEPMGVSYVNSEEEAQRRIRRVQVRLRAHLPILRVVQFPDARPFVKVEVVES